MDTTLLLSQGHRLLQLGVARSDPVGVAGRALLIEAASQWRSGDGRSA
jgi:hypothetical protein